MIEETIITLSNGSNYKILMEEIVKVLIVVKKYLGK